MSDSDEEAKEEKKKTKNNMKARVPESDNE